jgi:hypothetical protein
MQKIRVFWAIVNDSRMALFPLFFEPFLDVYSANKFHRNHIGRIGRGLRRVDSADSAE